MEASMCWIMQQNTEQSIIEKVRNLAEHFRWKPLETDDKR
jgi:hypothetical protein